MEIHPFGGNRGFRQKIADSQGFFVESRHSVERPRRGCSYTRSVRDKLQGGRIAGTIPASGYTYTLKIPKVP
jgi:hypothetical protein